MSGSQMPAGGTVNPASLAGSNAGGSNAIGPDPIGVGGGGGGGFMPVPSSLQPASAPAAVRVRAYFAPVDRNTETPTFFDPSQAAGFDPDMPPAPWLDLGWIEGFTRKSGSTISALRTGSPATVQGQVRSQIDATLSLRFLSWGKLQLALASGSEQMNLLAPTGGTLPAPSGATALTAARTVAGNTATQIALDSNTSAGLSTGDIVVIDEDYVKQAGFVGTGVSGAYIPNGGIPGKDPDYIRRISLNVGQIAAVTGTPPTSITLASPLLAGAPPAGMGVQAVVGFVDREGGSFFQEWSALFAAQGAQGDWIFYHYPRLQAMQSSAETLVKLAGAFDWTHLDAQFRALPAADPNDGAQIVCFRSYLPAPNAMI